jgi:predicted XRE-type DNA-binding protein
MNLSSTPDIAITHGSGDVFADLGFGPEEAANLRIKSELMLRLRKLMQANDWSIEQAAQMLETSEITIENLSSGQIAEFTVDQLVQLVEQSGLQVAVMEEIGLAQAIEAGRNTEVVSHSKIFKVLDRSV